MRTSAALLALCLGLSACGSSGGGQAASTPSSAAPSTSLGPQECPVKAAEVPPPPGSTTDLARKPTIAGSRTPPPSEVQVADIVEGTGAEAKTLSRVTTKYVGALYESGKEFDSSWSRGKDETIPFTVCSQDVVVGFSVAPTGMKVGGRRQVTIPARFGYGAEGRPPTIPGGATLVFVIDLVSTQDPG